MAPSSRSNRVGKIVLLGVFVHVIYLAAIFDVYFKSPIVQDLKPLPVTTNAPAKRLVLFIADGLRADKFFQTSRDFPKSRAPFLRSIIEKKGSWGVSHSRVPTETRPGHVAVIAGFFEDVSAVTKGWQENPVDFDSVFNQSRRSYCWGSCDIIPMFASKVTSKHVIGDCYKEDMIDFSDENGARLDEWVFSRVEQFFLSAQKNKTLNDQVRSDKLVLFLHLLGLDVNGHGYRPNSQEYLNNIISVDGGIRRVVETLESFYNHDGKTAYILTSDHGMSDWGSHGSGHPDETLTPIVAWGAGVQGPVKAQLENDFIEDKISRDWKLDGLKRLDVNQIDIAALMSTLVGIPFPVNSVGILPVDYINNTGNFKAENLFRNAKQILEQYKKKKSIVKNTALIFRPYKMSGSLQEEYTRRISMLIREGRYEEAMERSQNLIKLSLDGLRYYHSHNTLYIAFCATCGFIGWILLIIIEIFNNYTELGTTFGKRELTMDGSSHKKVRNIFFAVTLAILAISLFATSASLMEYLYCLMPLLVFYELSGEFLAITKIGKSFSRFSLITVLSFMTLYAVLLVSLVASFTHRRILTFILLGIAIFPVISKRKFTIYNTAWLFAGFSLSIFPLLPNIGREENYGLVAFAGLLTAATSLVFSCLPRNETGSSAVVTILVGAVTLCTFLRLHTIQSITSKNGLPWFNQFLSWTVVPTVPSLTLVTEKDSLSRLVSVITGLFAIYILTCISHEGIFVYILSLSMILWIKVEQELAQEPAPISHQGVLQKSVPDFFSISHVRISFMFLFFILLAFFGTGNIASLNSFDPAAVNCFITIFRPFVMASVLFLKILLPLVIVCCAFSAMKNSLGIQIRGLFFAVMVMTDIMSIMFFFLIKDEGSWQEIGTSITHFVIMLAFIIFLVPLFEISCLLTGSVTLERKKTHVN